MKNDVYEDFRIWIERAGKTVPPKGIVAFNFGIFETPNGHSIYLTGSREYDPGSDDWACNQDYVPEEKYFALPKDTHTREWQDVLEEVVQFIDRFVKAPEFSESLLASAVAITAGFDDGNLRRIK